MFVHQGRVLLLAAICTTFAWGQAQVSSGDVRGTVVDPAGAAIANAKVTVSDPQRGFARSVLSDAEGEYRVPLVPPGTYRVRAEAPGFNVKTAQGVEVRVGDTVVLRLQMQVGDVSTEVTVAAELPVVETERTQQANTIESRRIANLPINRRNYLDFALLAPGVVETNDLVDGTDFRVVQAPHSGLSFGGSNGRGNAILIDGVEGYLNSGGVRPSLSQEAVLEFQINRNSFNAEFGWATGGLINVITKSGTNEVHGNLFGFLRHRNIQARNYFDPNKSVFTRGQEGATFGAPIARDRTFFFAAYERLDRHETAFVPILQDRSAFGQLTTSQQQLASFFDNAPVPTLRPLGALMRQSLITNNFPNTLALFNNNSGAFPFSENNNFLSLRLDHRFSDKDLAFLRGNYSVGRNENAQFGALVGFNRGRSIKQTDGTITAGNNLIFNSRWIAETRLMFSYNKLEVIPTDRLGPDITISGYGSFGREIFLPSTTFERHYQAQQTFSYTPGRHAVKFGVDINPIRDVVRSETFFGGRFVFGEQIPLGALLPRLTGDPNAAATLVAAFTQLGQPQLARNLQVPLTALQAYNLGLPTLYQQGFGDPNWAVWVKRYGLFVQDSIKLAPSFTLNAGLRYELEDPAPPIKADKNNFSPRLGFAWSPAGDKLVVRGGYGIYYGRIDAQLSNLPATLDGVQIAQAAITASPIPGLNNPLTRQPLTSFDIYQGLLAQGVIGRRSITREDIARFGLVPGPNSFGNVRFGITPDYVNPYAQQASFEIERAMGNTALSASYVFNRGWRLPRILDRNLYYTGRTADNQPTFGFYNPLLLQNNVLESTAKSFYHSLVVQASRRFSRSFSFAAHYTLSKAIDEVTDFNSDFEPHDQLNAAAERALSSFDQRHRFVANAVIQSPVQMKRGQGFGHNLMADWTLSPIVVASSGRPFNVMTGFDNLNDRHPTTHRPFGAGRNIGHGPNLFTADLRLSRKIPFGAEGRRNVEFTAEGFNLLNRTNFKNVNNTVGSLQLSDLPRPIEGQRGVPTAPLSFTSAFDPRQFQFGLKINF
jgi:hypothetical protein